MKTIAIGHTDTTPLGDIWVAVSENGLIAVEFPVTQDVFTAWLGKRHAAAPIEFDQEKVKAVVEQMREYAAGTRREFTLPIDWSVLNEFQRKALKLTFDIPFGETRTYKEIAIALGNPRAARAVGRAEATNPMPIVLPCHRVVGSDNKLHGYGAGTGIPTKEWLLRLEKALIP
jgi:methylated-DNA-[protein]-cysteine S-methyltransferase